MAPAAADFSNEGIRWQESDVAAAGNGSGNIPTGKSEPAMTVFIEYLVYILDGSQQLTIVRAKCCQAQCQHRPLEL